MSLLWTQCFPLSGTRGGLTAKARKTSARLPPLPPRPCFSCFHPTFQPPIFSITGGTRGLRTVSPPPPPHPARNRVHAFVINRAIGFRTPSQAPSMTFHRSMLRSRSSAATQRRQNKKHFLSAETRTPKTSVSTGTVGVLPAEPPRPRGGAIITLYCTVPYYVVRAIAFA